MAERYHINSSCTNYNQNPEMGGGYGNNYSYEYNLPPPPQDRFNSNYDFNNGISESVSSFYHGEIYNEEECNSYFTNPIENVFPDQQYYNVGNRNNLNIGDYHNFRLQTSSVGIFDNVSINSTQNTSMAVNMLETERSSYTRTMQPNVIKKKIRKSSCRLTNQPGTSALIKSHTPDIGNSCSNTSNLLKHCKSQGAAKKEQTNFQKNSCNFASKKPISAVNNNNSNFNLRNHNLLPTQVFTNQDLKQENLIDCSYSGIVGVDPDSLDVDEADLLRGPLNIDIPVERSYSGLAIDRDSINKPLDIDIPLHEVQSFIQNEKSKQGSNLTDVIEEMPITYQSIIQSSSTNEGDFFRLSPTSDMRNSGSVIQNGISNIDELTKDLLVRPPSNEFNDSKLNCNIFGVPSVSVNNEVIEYDVKPYKPEDKLNLFFTNSQPCTSDAVSLPDSLVELTNPVDNGFKKDIIYSAQIDLSKENGYRPRVDNSPERKYLHLIKDKLTSNSPEREFLERINSKKRSRSRSSSAESYERRCKSTLSNSDDRHRFRRSRSVSQGRISRHLRSPKRVFKSSSKSPVRSCNSSRLSSPRQQRNSRLRSRSPVRSYHSSQKRGSGYRSNSKSPSTTKCKYLSAASERKHNADGSRTSSPEAYERHCRSSCSNLENRHKNLIKISGAGRFTSNKSSYVVSPERIESLDRKRRRIDGDDDRSLKISCKSSNNMPSDTKTHYTEREELLLKYQKDYCSDANEMRHKLNELSKLDVDELMKRESHIWTRMSPANLYYKKTDNSNIVEGTLKLEKLCNEFEDVLLKRAERVRETQPKYELPVRKKKMKVANLKIELCSSNSSSSDSDHDISSDEEDITMEELERKRSHPFRLHPELWFNDAGEMNDGPLCRCSAKARRSGIRHNIYAGELNLPKCDLNKNNANNLYHYRITISPPTNFLIKTPTIIPHDDHEFIFEGFSMFSHIRLDKLPVCKVIRFNIEYTILYFEEKMPENFTIKELDLFYEYLFKEILELVDLDFRAGGDKSRCAQFHFMPRFVRELPENGKEILSMNEVLSYLLKNCENLINIEELKLIDEMPQYEWQKKVDLVKGMVVTIPGMKPCSLRVDQLDRDKEEGKTSLYPEIVHFGIRPPQLSYAGNPEYQKAWREYVKFRHLLANMPKPSFEDKRKLELKENKLQEMRTQSKMKRDVTVTVNSEGFKKTGIMCDIVQHAMLIPVLVSHLRFHCSLGVLEEAIHYKFKNRFLLQLALTHPSYRENFGTNPDHARNSLTNCGIRQPEYGDRRIHYMNTRKRGINTLINIMSRFGKKTETESNITHNERLEFLGDAVVEFITSIHLFHIFPDLEEGGLATYRAAIVQNQHLAVLAKALKLDEFMLYAHGSDLCHDLELRHAMANCFEALMGALFLDGGIEVADKVFGETLFKDHQDITDIWVNYPPHPLQEQEPLGDRKWIPKFELLQKLTKFEELIGVEFTHIRLLARAFTDRSMGFTNLTLGSNQRLEFLGDTVLQLIASEYLYKYFPEHHEGHLSLLRSSLVNNRTQAVVCNDLGMQSYALYHNPKAELKTKDRADLLEAFLGALYVDKGLEHCEVFCNVCFFPRLQMFIMRQDWNDPKSKLQQCCLTLRTMEGGEPEIPIYKVIECMGPTNTRVYTVAVYFKGRRLAEASGHSIQQAEMNAAKKALQRSYGLFPQLDHQKRVIAKSLKTQPNPWTLKEGNGDSNQRAGKKSFINKPPFKDNRNNDSTRYNSNYVRINNRNFGFKKIGFDRKKCL